MSRKVKRADYRAPTRRSADPASAQDPLRPDDGVRDPRAGSWWPLVVAAALIGVLVLIVVIANLDSPPPLTVP